VSYLPDPLEDEDNKTEVEGDTETPDGELTLPAGVDIQGPASTSADQSSPPRRGAASGTENWRAQIFQGFPASSEEVDPTITDREEFVRRYPNHIWHERLLWIIEDWENGVGLSTARIAELAGGGSLGLTRDTVRRRVQAAHERVRKRAKEAKQKTSRK